MKKKILLFALPLILVSFTIASQQDFIKNLTEKLNSYQLNAPEKIYVHTDKPFYSLDENIWFSVYLVNGITHTKASKSKVVHVELLNAKDSVLEHKKLFVNHIAASGDFKIEENWQEGTYLLRAYTNYMRNDKNEIYFQKQIVVHNIQKKESNLSTDAKLAEKEAVKETTKKDIKAPKIYFYPEGGYSVVNQPSTIAFEVKSNTFGNIKIQGVIKDELDNEITSFKTTDLNLGRFTLIPEANKSYFACVEINNKEVKYPLPKALSSGYLLNATNLKDHLLIKVSSTEKQGLLGSYLVAHQRGELLFQKFEDTEKKESIVKLPYKGIKDGVTHITLFNKDGKPVAERLVFIENPENQLTYQISTSKKQYGIRKKVNVALHVKNANGQNINSSVSMAVRYLKAYPYNNRTGNIKTWLLLNSDLRGQIKNPNYFFNKPNDPKRKYLLDLVMLTHGWRRFTWSELLNNEMATQQYQPEIGLFISGKTKYLKRPYTEFSAPVRLTFLGKKIAQEPIKQSDSLGVFQYGPYVFFDSIPVIIESRKDKFKSTRRKSRDVVILVDQEKKSDIHMSKEVLFHKTEQEKKDLELKNFIKVTKYIKEEKFKFDQQVQKLTEIEIKAKRRTALEKRADEMDALTDYGSLFDSQRLDVLNDFPGAGALTAFEIVAQMNDVDVISDTIFVRRQRNVPATILIDGLEVDSDFLQSINGDEISFVDVLKGTDAIAVPNAAGGVVALYSNTGNVGSRNVKRKPGIIDFQAKGFYTAKKFYSPDHVNDFELINEIDLRTTLYWEPLIRTKVKEDVKLSFFTSDLRSDYLIEIEGVSDAGVPIHGYTTFTVE